ncbi:restriction endonuclease subunit S [Shewanella algae]|uniref:restriction endonuclease subunit S n=1 Tax=Shewanella algae TaxID=38313 RepID=UPI0031F504DD
MSGQAASYSKYIAYPEYRDSGVQWLPSFPQHWKVERVKRMLHLRRCLVGSRSAEYQLLSLTLRGIITRDISKGEGKIPESFETYQKVQKSDLVFCLFDMDETPRTVGLSDLDGMITGAYNVYGCLPRCFPGYAGYYFLHLDKFKGLRPFYTGLRKVVRAETFDNIDMPCPPIEEQRTIAAFLDYETARIDSLIDKQQRLIELLKEKRQAVISHAVTKGLSYEGQPDAPMKDSGVEWLGQVPEHWIVTRAKFLFKFVTSGSRGWAEYYTDEGDLFFRIANLTRDTIKPKLESIQNVTPPKGAEGQRSRIQAGDLLISITADIGSVCVADHSVSGGYVSQHVALARPNEKVISEDWLGYFVLSDASKEQLLGSGYGGTKIQLSLEDVRELWVALPPHSEQNHIASFLQDELHNFESLMTRADVQISLLQERRTALISAAVTGKIDLRGWTPPVREDVA